MPRRQKAHDLGDLLTDYLLCRDIGHTWKIIKWERWQLDRVQRTLRCQRCKTVRTDRMRHDGSLYNRWYDYVENFLLKETKDRSLGIRVANVREELMRRIEAADQLVESKQSEE